MLKRNNIFPVAPSVSAQQNCTDGVDTCKDGAKSSRIVRISQIREATWECRIAFVVESSSPWPKCSRLEINALHAYRTGEKVRRSGSLITIVLGCHGVYARTLDHDKNITCYGGLEADVKTA